MEKREISFSPPDITDEEIAEVSDALRSGWITTGPKTKELEKKLADYVGTSRFVALNSGTAAMELTYRLFGIGPGDEVITTAYTYTATAAAAAHVGAKVVLVDMLGDRIHDDYQGHSPYEPDYDQIDAAITDRTKAIVPVDLGGVMCDYDRLIDMSRSHAADFRPSDNKYQQALGRILIMADDAHALGARRMFGVSLGTAGRGSSGASVADGSVALRSVDEPKREYRAGQAADFSCFSFHAVKNFTTAEGGGVSWRSLEGIDDAEIYQDYMILSLHGQSKDALAKARMGAWEYDILYPGYKCNMTDMAAALGLAQLRRYPGLLERRRRMIAAYDEGLSGGRFSVLKHYTDSYTSSGHLYLMRVEGLSEAERSDMITRLAEEGVATNVHYKPLPMLTAYKDLGFRIEDYPQAYRYFANEITLPLHTLLSDGDIDYIIDRVVKVAKEY